MRSVDKAKVTVAFDQDRVGSGKVIIETYEVDAVKEGFFLSAFSGGIFCSVRACKQRLFAGDLGFGSGLRLGFGVG